MVRQQLFIGAALIAGAAIGYFIQPEPVKPQAHASVDETAPAKLIEDKGESASIAALRARVRELEAKLAQAHASDEELVSNTVERLEVARRDRRPEGGQRDWMAELKERDPERYVQMTNNFARWRQERRSQQAERASFLASVDTSRMSAGARKTHSAFQSLLERREALEEKMHNPDLAFDERRELMSEMQSIRHELNETREAERKVLLNEVARAVGLEGAAASELVQTIGGVYEATEDGHRGPGGGPGRGSRRGMQPPRGR